MIRVDVTSKRFGDTPILGPISFEISPGETVALVGPSGIGKSTLLRLISGLDSDFAGTVTRPDAMAFGFQEPTLLPWRAARENLRLIHPGLSVSEAEAALDSVGLGGKGDFFPGQLSLGQQRRLSLARAFAGTPDLLIMDEPFASLDADMTQTMLTLTEALIARHTPATLLVTHDMSEATRLATRILTLQPTPDGATLI
jgi:NitT/TauT family transport system ATP-binding protein